MSTAEDADTVFLVIREAGRETDGFTGELSTVPPGKPCAKAEARSVLRDGAYFVEAFKVLYVNPKFLSWNFGFTCARPHRIRDY